MDATSVKLRGALVLAIGFVLGALVTVTQGVIAERERTAELPYEQARMLAEVLERVKENYVEDIDDEELMERAIRGMLKSLDDHSSFMDPEEYRRMRESTTGRFGGVGIEVSHRDGKVRVVAPIEGTPADRAGIRTGDTILSVDGESLEGRSLDAAVRKMRGEIGTEVTVTIEREETGETEELTLTREEIQQRTVRQELLDPGIGYVRITNFRERGAEQTQEAVEELIKENEGHLDGLIIDLRNNPGGLLRSAVSISDLFLEQGKIVSAEGRGRHATMEREATLGDLMVGGPIVVLVNRGSASASEIFAGAMQDHERGVVMGSKTFGKGSVQTILPLPDQSAMKLTTARYFTPSGRSIEKDGVEPDLYFEDEEPKVRTGSRLGEEALNAWHSADKVEEAIAEEDRMLREAVRVLRGMKLRTVAGDDAGEEETDE